MMHLGVGRLSHLINSLWKSSATGGKSRGSDSGHSFKGYRRGVSKSGREGRKKTEHTSRGKLSAPFKILTVRGGGKEQPSATGRQKMQAEGRKRGQAPAASDASKHIGSGKRE